ncbi:hypothetical protein HIM_11010 [Hirsutella minnesotensis 3608]|uniref:FAR1 domain-containing protein n=1 Tax=Hirsutella minnesotensis 3608 TaxID=1043627 RepID=A0A0F7ZFR4_9HYPO|nr:hypothetical protein HIM_11010 [Hirsutella minnesotensis 3608]
MQQFGEQSATSGERGLPSGLAATRHTRHFRPPTSSSDAESSIDQHYGVGDDALYNIFAAHPQAFTTVPKPHGLRGLNETGWCLRFDQEIELSNDFPTHGRPSQLARAPIPGPDTVPANCPRLPQLTEEQPSPTAPQFQSALQIVREVIGTDRRLTLDLVQSYERVRQWREKWGYPSLPAGSPSQERPPTTVSSPDRSSSSIPDTIPNPTDPGEAETSAEALYDRVNAFAKNNGFGIVRRNAYSYKGRKVRYTFQCDRFGEPGPPQGTGLRRRKSRKCGCKWMVIAEALEEGLEFEQRKRLA